MRPPARPPSSNQPKPPAPAPESSVPKTEKPLPPPPKPDSSDKQAEEAPQSPPKETLRALPKEKPRFTPKETPRGTPPRSDPDGEEMLRLGDLMVGYDRLTKQAQEKIEQAWEDAGRPGQDQLDPRKHPRLTALLRDSAAIQAQRGEAQQWLDRLTRAQTAGQAPEERESQAARNRELAGLAAGLNRQGDFEATIDGQGGRVVIRERGDGSTLALDLPMEEAIPLLRQAQGEDGPARLKQTIEEYQQAEAARQAEIEVLASRFREHHDNGGGRELLQWENHEAVEEPLNSLKDRMGDPSTWSEDTVEWVKEQEQQVIGLASLADHARVLEDRLQTARARRNELLNRANEGTISADESAELSELTFQLADMSREAHAASANYAAAAKTFQRMEVAMLMADVIETAESPIRVLDVIFEVSDAAANGAKVGGLVGGGLAARDTWKKTRHLKSLGPKGHAARIGLSGLGGLRGALFGAAQGGLSDATVEQLKQWAAEGSLEDLPDLLRNDPAAAMERLGTIEDSRPSGRS